MISSRPDPRPGPLGRPQSSVPEGSAGGHRRARRGGRTPHAGRVSSLATYPTWRTTPAPAGRRQESHVGTPAALVPPLLRPAMLRSPAPRMTDPATFRPDADVRRTTGALFLAGAMLLSMPLVAIQGPVHTTPMDAVNVLFIGRLLVLHPHPARDARVPAHRAVLADHPRRAARALGAPCLDGLLVLAEDLYLTSGSSRWPHFLAPAVHVGRVGCLDGGRVRAWPC